MNEIELLKKIISGKRTVFVKEIKSQKCSSVIYVPKEYDKKKAVIWIIDEESTEENNESETETDTLRHT